MLKNLILIEPGMRQIRTLLHRRMLLRPGTGALRHSGTWATRPHLVSYITSLGKKRAAVAQVAALSSSRLHFSASAATLEISAT